MIDAPTASVSIATWHAARIVSVPFCSRVVVAASRPCSASDSIRSARSVPASSSSRARSAALSDARAAFSCVRMCISATL